MKVFEAFLVVKCLNERVLYFFSKQCIAINRLSMYRRVLASLIWMTLNSWDSHSKDAISSGCVGQSWRERDFAFSGRFGLQGNGSRLRHHGHGLGWLSLCLHLHSRREMRHGPSGNHMQTQTWVEQCWQIELPYALVDQPMGSHGTWLRSELLVVFTNSRWGLATRAVTEVTKKAVLRTAELMLFSELIMFWIPQAVPSERHGNAGWGSHGSPVCGSGFVQSTKRRMVHLAGYLLKTASWKFCSEDKLDEQGWTKNCNVHIDLYIIYIYIYVDARRCT